MQSRRLRLALVAAVCMMFTAAAARADESAFVANPVEHVDTLIGTATAGDEGKEGINNFPGAAMPFGMVQYSPDTVDTYAGYDNDIDRSTGFSLTHASVSCSRRSVTMVAPPVGEESILSARCANLNWLHELPSPSSD